VLGFVVRRLAWAIVLFVVLSFILVNLVTDLVCAYLDPRIRFDR